MPHSELGGGSTLAGVSALRLVYSDRTVRIGPDMSAYVGAIGELTLDTTLVQLAMHDGVTPGGIPISSGGGGGGGGTTLWVIENRTSDPPPEIGRIWLRIDE